MATELGDVFLRECAWKHRQEHDLAARWSSDIIPRYNTQLLNTKEQELMS